MRWKINYYLNEGAQRTGVPAYSETINGDRNLLYLGHKIKLEQAISNFTTFNNYKKLNLEFLGPIYF